MTDSPTRTLDAVLRADFLAFVEKCMGTLSPATTLMRNWHVQAMAYHLEQCRLGHIRRLIITLPPRHLKSVCASVAFPAWLLAHQPSAKVLSVSYNADLAGHFARDTREVMESDWYRRVFPETRLSRRRSADMDFLTTKRGGRYATSPGGPLTGRGASFIIMDDPIKADDVQSDVMREKLIRWFRETLITRLDDKRNDVIILVMQRLHVDDLAGHLLRTGEWVHLDLPAIAQEHQKISIAPGIMHTRREGDLLHAEREGNEILDALKRDMGTRAFSAQYLQRPTEPDGTIIRWSWFKFVDTLGDRLRTDEIVQSWDTASKVALTNDYSVCTTWLIRDEKWYLLDIFRSRLEYPDLRRRIDSHGRNWRADRILIEDASSGQALIQEFADRKPAGATWYLEPIKVVADKVQRAEVASVAIEAGRVFLLKDAEYLEELRQELVSFPRGHDDQIDSMTQFISWASSCVKYVGQLIQGWAY